MIEISKREQFYHEYCGCVYSLRDTNLKIPMDALYQNWSSTTVKKGRMILHYVNRVSNVSIYGMPTVIFESSLTNRQVTYASNDLLILKLKKSCSYDVAQNSFSFFYLMSVHFC